MNNKICNLANELKDEINAELKKNISFKQPGEIPRCGDIYIRKANDLKKQLANHEFSSKEKEEILEAINIFESTSYYKNTID